MKKTQIRRSQKKLNEIIKPLITYFHPTEWHATDRNVAAGQIISLDWLIWTGLRLLDANIFSHPKGKVNLSALPCLLVGHASTLCGWRGLSAFTNDPRGLAFPRLMNACHQPLQMSSAAPASCLNLVLQYIPYRIWLSWAWADVPKSRTKASNLLLRICTNCEVWICRGVQESRIQRWSTLPVISISWRSSHLTGTCGVVFRKGKKL